MRQGQELKDAHAVKLPCFRNLSLCHYKLEDYAKALDTADKALKISEDDVKGRFRRGQVGSSLEFVAPALAELLN